MPHETERAPAPPPGASRAREAAPLDADTVRTWCALALDALGRDRERIDAINVFPVADGDTGTNLYLTLESAAGAVEAVFGGHDPHRPTLAEAAGAMAHGALIGARGNSGTILAQLLRGMAQVFADLAARPPDAARNAAPTAPADDPAGPDAGARPPRGGDANGRQLARALRRAAEAAYAAVAHPVEGTVLTVAARAADAAHACPEPGHAAAVARAAHDGALTALAATQGQLAELSAAGVVDAGGRGLVTVLAALVEALTGVGSLQDPAQAGAFCAPATQQYARESHDAGGCTQTGGGPAFEVIYLLEAADDAAVEALRSRLDTLGDSLVVVGGDGLWHIHIHTDDAGAAVEAAVETGRPHRIRITHFGPPSPAGERPGAGERAQRAVVAVVPGDGLAGLCAEAGATAVLGRPGELPVGGELVEAVRRTHAREVVLLPNSDELRHSAAAAVAQARAQGLRVALIPTRSAVQGLAALAVHEPGRSFDEDVVAMTAAAGSTRHGELTLAERQSWTTAGVCQAGDVLGHIDGDVAVIGEDPATTAVTVLDRMLSAGGEMVTLVVSDDLPDDVTARLEEHVRRAHLAVDTVVYRGGRQAALLLIGVE